MKHLLQRSYLKISDHKSGKRLWIQGLRLEEAGYEIGASYLIDYDEAKRQVTILLAGDGERKVSRKKVGDRFYPLIDLVNARLAQIFADVERVQVSLRDGEILIEYHHLDDAKHRRESMLWQRLREGLALRIASMAHGAGILDYYLHLGLEDQRIRSGMIWAVEPENVYLQTSLNNNPVWSYQCTAIEGRIEDVRTDELPRPDILVAGLPCTGASRAGRSKNRLKFAEAHESSGTAFIGWLMAIRQIMPAVLVLENVVEYRNTVSMHLIRETLENWRYRLHEVIVGPELGAFEDRRRLCMVAVSDGIDFRFELEPVRKAEETLGEILEDVSLNADCWNACEYLHRKEERDRKAGKGFAMQLVDERSEKVGTIGRSYHKWRSTEPLVVHPENPSLKRQLTVNEVARVKTINPRLVAGMSRTRQIEMLGQSVLGVAFRAVGRNIGRCLAEQLGRVESPAV